MLRAILNKSWQQHPTRHQLYGHLPPITKTIQVRRTRHPGHCWRSRDELIRDVLIWIPTHGRAKAGRPARTYIQQLCEDTGCCSEDLPRAMNDRAGVAREGQGYPCYQRDMMMMMTIRMKSVVSLIKSELLECLAIWKRTLTFRDMWKSRTQIKAWLSLDAINHIFPVRISVRNFTHWEELEYRGLLFLLC